MLPDGCLPVQGAASVWSESQKAWLKSSVNGVALPGSAYALGSLCVSYTDAASRVHSKVIDPDHSNLVMLP